MMKIAAAAMGMLALSGQAMDIKGIEVGKPADCPYIKSLETREGTFFNACEAGKSSWFFQSSFLQHKAMFVVEQGPDRIIRSIYTQKFNFDVAIQAIALKYGPPKLEESVITNRMGATFQQVEATWETPSAVMKIKKHGSRVDEPTLLLVSRQALSDVDIERKSTVKEAAKDI